MNEVALPVSDFVALVNQTFEYAYPFVAIVGELANFKVSKNRWVYFDLKDEFASVRFFGTVYALPGPLEDGMMLEVRGSPRLHQQFGFSVNVQSIRPVGEGSIKKAANLLEAKLRAEGLFDDVRKRPLPYPPKTIGLITSKESAAYADFTKILNARWCGLDIRFIDVQVQGESAPGQIVAAIEQFNQMAEQPAVLVVIRGGGSADDLQAFSTEQVTRAVAASRIPTLVAIGHEVDVSLAELAADCRASTPSNAAELLVPDKKEMLARLRERREAAAELLVTKLATERDTLQTTRDDLLATVQQLIQRTKDEQQRRRELLKVLSPDAALRRGYAIVHTENGHLLRSAKETKPGAIIEIQLADSRLRAAVKEIE
jgi:exodeoxyribonuclease VII large subunit